jgi:2-desacetyl-2-hydroxyethyl bacteriochlorophyllide A dehydrogenase
MKAAVYCGVRDIRVEEVPKPQLRPGEVLVRVKACGICGSDLHMYKHGLFLDLGRPMGSGRVMGHEWSGEVAEINGEVPTLKVGSRISSALGGANAEYLRVPASAVPFLFRIPEGVSYEEAATTEPLANSVHSVGLASPSSGQTVVVLGLGIVGLGAIQVLKAWHSVRIIAVDISEKRLAMAKQLGADHTFNARREDPVQKILEVVGSTRIRFLDEPVGNVDAAIDWAGVSMENMGTPTLEQALQVVRQDGVVVLGAVSEKPFQMDFNRIMLKGIRLFGSWGWAREEFAKALELIGSGKINRKSLVTHQFPLEKAKEAYETAANTAEAIKVLIIP